MHSCVLPLTYCTHRARIGHVALAVDASASWGEELLLIHGGLSEERLALSDLVVLQVRLITKQKAAQQL